MRKIHGLALITGASSGIGKEFADILASRGCDLVITSRRGELLNQLKESLEGQYGVKVTVITADLSRPQEAERLYACCREQNLPVTILVNNAGLGLFSPVVGASPEKIHDLLVLNTLSLTVLCSLFGSDFQKNGKGWILNVGSLVGHFAIPYFSIYASSKAYVRNFSRAFRSEMKGTGVSVTCLEPGFVRTGFDDNSGITAEKYRKNSQAMGMTPRKVAQIGVKALFSRRALVVAGFTNKLGALSSRLLPEWMTTAIFGSQVRKMTGL